MTLRLIEMKMKRVLAKDTRTALAMIKESLGEDAIIFSNTKIAGEVEIVAAIDDDSNHSTANNKSVFSDQLGANLDLIKLQEKQYQHAIPPAHISSKMDPPSVMESQSTKVSSNQLESSDNIVKMEKELGLLRLLIEQQVTNSPMQTKTFISGAAIKVAQRLERMGFEQPLIDPLLAQLPACDDPSQLWGYAQQWLQDNLTARSEECVPGVGIYALVGPTGVGKTTTIGKLGAQLAMKHGKHKVALVSMDQQRIGAKDQLRIFGAMLGIEVHHVADFDELTACLSDMSHKDYILLDTSGENPFDRTMEHLVKGLIGVPHSINVYLTLAANSQSHSLRYLMKHYVGKVKGVVATKLDECLPLGGLLAALIESKQPLMMISNGQRIPLDLGYPNPKQLVAHAMEAELLEEHGSIEALSKLLHTSKKVPSRHRQKAPKAVIPITESGVCTLQDDYLRSLELASYRRH